MTRRPARPAPDEGRAEGAGGRAALPAATARAAQAAADGPRRSGTVDRLCVLNGGLAVAPDRSVCSPGRWQGGRVALSCNAYLIRRAGAWLLRDTGIADAIAEEPGGRVIAQGIRGIVARIVGCQLADVDIAPADVRTVILSHARFDHVGDAATFGPDHGQHGYAPSLYAALERARVELMDGDLDLLGDGSVRVVSTPGHTPGHCSLPVRLMRTGPVLLSADVAHDRFNMEHRRVPGMNSHPEQPRSSMEPVDALVRAEGAQLRLNHDIVQAATIAHAPPRFD